MRPVLVVLLLAISCHEGASRPLCEVAHTKVEAAPEITTDTWNGFVRLTFKLEGRTCYLVKPKVSVHGKPWLWRARFWGHRPEVDIALLGKGYHLVYMDVAELLGDKEAVRDWDELYWLLRTKYGLNKKAELEGMSRGGLYVYAWAEANPHKVAAIYADAPVCDITSWPLALRNGKPDEKSWNMVVAAFGFHDLDEARNYRGNPIDNLKPLARAHVPLLHVVGDADNIVPVAENTAVLAERYRALGGEITIIVKPGIGHVHGLDNPTPIIDFLDSHRPS
jgi:pimeloyl-ACP methyl ester carboxylesterase